MGIFNKKAYFDQEDKEELRLRQQQINEQMIIIEGLKAMMNNWFASKLEKYGLDAGKQWTVNPATGQINELPDKKEPKP